MAEKTYLNRKLLDQKKPYYLGLDLGTNSIGWAVTNKEYVIVKKAGKALWGVRLFQEASTAASRRAFRTARRRRKRTKQRIALLQEYFAEAIASVDMGFYQRMKDSFFYPDDKAVEQPYALFADDNFTDQDFHKKYPTIYHLRHDLMSSTEPHDVRLVYLACHHIMKNRGNFLQPGERFETGAQFDDSFSDLNETLEAENLPFWNSSDKDKLRAILTDRDLRKRDKISMLSEMKQTSSDDLRTISELIVGYKTTLSKLFSDEELTELEPKKISLADDYDESRSSYEEILGDRIEVIDAAKKMYDWMILNQMLGEFSSISEARVAIYEKHSADLLRLKDVVRQIQHQQNEETALYASVFRLSQKKLNNYVAYTGHSSGKLGRNEIHHRCNDTDFRKFIKGVLEKHEDILQVPEILAEIEQEIFLPKISSSGNGVVPRQLMAAELEAILENAKAYLPFLTDEICRQIVQIFNFRIPYYIGPLDSRSSFSWIKRRQFIPVRPWNIESVVDIESTADQFIRNLTSKCTYLIGEDVLPKSSLLYSEFMVRNAINMLTISGQRLDNNFRAEIYDKLFRHRTKSGKVTKSRIASLLRSCGLDVTDKQIGGMDVEIPGTLKAEQELEQLVGSRLTYREKEDVIAKVTVLPDSGDMLLNWLKKEFGEKLTDKECEALARLKFRDWGSLSGKLLNGLREEAPDGQTLSIIDRMREEPVTLMELLSEKYGYAGLIKKHNASMTDDSASFSYDEIHQYRTSPAVKKMIWQTMRVCMEIFSIMGGVPEKIFLEVTRKKEVTGTRSDSRKSKLIKLYESIREEVPSLLEALRQTDDASLKSKRLFLYYQQLGRCMYSGSEIDLGDLLSNKSHYDIDHIFPRSLTKDDSFDNLVLVDQSLNREKTDAYPIAEGIRKKQFAFWKRLLHCELISLKKYERLSRSHPLTSEELEGFINRQLVETSQSIKLVSQILDQFVQKSDMVYVKATHVSDFRYKYGTAENAPTQFYFPKVREINDLHHAKDAYLNIVVGNAFDTKFTKNFAYYIKSEPHRSYNLDRFFDWKIERNNYVAWEPGEDGTIAAVKKMMSRNNILVTRESFRQKGGFFDQMIVKKGNGQHPIKTSNLKLHNINRYGAFNKVAGSHFCIVEHTKRGKKVRTIMSVPILLARSELTEQHLIDYFEQQEGLSDCKILVPELKYGSTLLIDGVGYILKAKTGNSYKCAQTNQAYFSASEENLLKHLDRVTSKSSESYGDDDVTEVLFNSLVAKLGNPPFCNYSSLALKARELEEKYETFMSKDVATRFNVIKAILRLLSCNGDLVDLSDIGMKKQVGMITISNNLSAAKTYAVKNTSITGFFESVTEI